MSSFLLGNNALGNKTSLSKNDNGTLRVGNRLPSDIAPKGEVIGDLWYDTTVNTLKAWNGTQWIAIGIAEQSGSTVQVTDGSGNITVTYPITFPSTPQCVVLTNGEDSQGVFWLSMLTRNANNFTFKVRNTGATPATGALVRINWIAMLSS